eukprot:GGOE01036144.1.p1 GENE.GGOE01036144.1~~GGOE01036144.1.p1  ORF type:complete len:469 (-),score=63.00 GGOE01036144.1:328-1734(-)
MQQPIPAGEVGKIQSLTGTSGNWAAELTDPNWTGDDSPRRNWERPNPSWNTMGKEIAGLWPSKEKSTEDPSDADILAFLGLGKDTQLSQLSDQSEHETFLSCLGKSRNEQLSKLVTLSTEDTDLPVEALCRSASKTLEPAAEPWEVEVSKMTDSGIGALQTKSAASTLNVSALPFQPGKGGAKLNPAAVPFVPSGVRGALHNSPNEVVSTFRNGDSALAADTELARAQASIRHYQNIFISTKEELQVHTKLYQKEKDNAKKTQEALDQRVKEADRLRSELQGEANRCKQATEQLAALQAEMAYHRKVMEQVQGQIKVSWTQFVGQLQQEKLSRQAAEENVTELQTSLQASSQQTREQSSKIAELQDALKDAQFHLQQQQEKATAKEEEATFYRKLYATAAKQVECCQAAVKASIELERQARQEAEAQLAQGRDPLSSRGQTASKQAPTNSDVDELKRPTDLSRDQESA